MAGGHHTLPLNWQHDHTTSVSEDINGHEASSRLVSQDSSSTVALKIQFFSYYYYYYRNLSVYLRFCNVSFSKLNSLYSLSDNVVYLVLESESQSLRQSFVIICHYSVKIIEKSWNVFANVALKKITHTFNISNKVHTSIKSVTIKGRMSISTFFCFSLSNCLF